ncbi:hypothetical protein SAMN05192574_101348 [Mucilaginibacter gossypiicola]|uniref:Uncharacterized protein n=1 Tax=Mucilaginibacter gossypiicola TaxID=551995 RepID=A0A1H8A6G1_9SPHI|nr:hypothetical protein SAMN05192574_101348 [Mucilaginibacter gossypiicola]
MTSDMQVKRNNPDNETGNFRYSNKAAVFIIVLAFR